MPRMIELIRQSAVPANIMRAAARGALALPPAEMIEILVQLTENPVFAQESRMTLAGWDDTSSLAAASDPRTPPAVLDYFSKRENLRPRLVPALLENPAVGESRLVDIAHHASRELIPLLLASSRVQTTANVLHALAGNQRLEERQTQRVREMLVCLGEQWRPFQAEESVPYEVAHAAEIVAEEGKPFALVTLTGDILGLGFDGISTAPPTEDAVATLEVLPALQAKTAEAGADPAVQKRISTLHRIAKLSVGERVQLAMKGSREERFILIRDGCKVVALAVLESPKLAENEVEVFASMRNVQEIVLRTIALKRRFMKAYAVGKALVNNPRTPLDVALTLLSHLLINDLRMLSANKNVSDTIRKLATKLYKQKKTATGQR
ncbi:MAG TPA: hypothetical protein VES66_07070 [Terriglobales bacterium]|nr:hypothetical protein [Terriglobales bacterium]